MSRLTVIVAATKSNGIGQNSGLPWRLAKEMRYFAQVTSQAPEGHKNAVIMGRNTWESIPKKFRPLPKRLNVVPMSELSLKDSECEEDASPDVQLANSLPSAVRSLSENPSINRVFLIGGGSLYHEALSGPFGEDTPFVDRILLTRITDPDFDCDVFFPELNGESGNQWVKSTHAELQGWVGIEVPAGIQEEKGVKYEFQMWTRAT